MIIYTVRTTCLHVHQDCGQLHDLSAFELDIRIQIYFLLLYKEDNFSSSLLVRLSLDYASIMAIRPEL